MTKLRKKIEEILDNKDLMIGEHRFRSRTPIPDDLTRTSKVNKLLSLCKEYALSCLPRKYDELEDWNNCIDQIKENIKEAIELK